MRRRNPKDCEIRTYVTEETYSALVRLAERRDQALSDVMRQALRFYLFGCTLELKPRSTDRARE
jgi:Ribbon-helix-helix protein, copG family